ncbi:hypothetical protein ACFLSG_04315 [Candidatus Bipolaricaulota bacterium]
MAGLLRFKLSKTPEEVDSVLTHLVRDADRRVPFYRDLFREAGTDVARFNGASKLTAFPPSTKEAFRKSPQRGHLREGRDPLRCATTSTSGSTGERLTIYFSRPELYFRRYSLLATYGHYMPLRLPLRVADVGPLAGHTGRSIEQRLGLVNILRIPGDAPITEQREALSKYRPTILQGYPTCLERLAESLSEGEARRLRPLLIACRGELLRQDTRTLLERILRARVVDLYNCEEVGNLAWECPNHAGRFHVNLDTCVLEVLDDDGKPTERQGDIVVTNLYNRTMPFLRYRLGDEATIRHAVSACSCGAVGPLLEDFVARQYDFVSTPGGQRVSPRVLTSVLFHALRSADDPHRIIPDVRRYQIVQEEDYSLRVVLDWKGPPDSDLWHRIACDIEQACQGLRCTVEKTSALELTPAGKFKAVLSRAP